MYLRISGYGIHSAGLDAIDEEDNEVKEEEDRKRDLNYLKSAS